MSVLHFKRNSREFEIAFFQKFIDDWKKKRQTLISEFERVKECINSTTFESNLWPRRWALDRPNVSALDIGNAIMFMTLAEPFLELRLEAIQMVVQKCEDPRKWADLNLQLQQTWEELHSASSRDADLLVQNLDDQTLMRITRGEAKNFEVIILENNFNEKITGKV